MKSSLFTVHGWQYGLGFRVRVLGMANVLKLQGLGFGVEKGLGFRVKGLRFKV
jgi:hypothetical protein